jgi:hypothetical protein
MAWTSLFLACERTRRAWRMASSTMEATWRVRLAGWLRGDERRQVGWRQEAMDANPCYWLGCRLWYKRWIVWAGLGVLALLWLAGFAQVGWPWVYDEGVALLSVLVLHTVLRWWIAAEACLAFGSDKQSGALELLLCTGLSVPEIVRGRLLALQRQFLAPSIGVLLFDLWMLAVVLSRASSAGDESWWVACFVCLALVYVADMVALAWLGLWWSLVCRRATRALLRCGVIVFGVPWALLVGFLVLLGVAGVILPRPVEFLLLGAYVLVGLGVSLVACSRARENLLYRLRSVTAGESSPPLQQRGVYATMPEGKP